MAKRLLFSILIFILLLPATSSPVSAQNQTDVKNVILVIGDGMGFEHVRLGSFVEYGNDSGLFMQQFYRGNLTTHSADEDVTDSAASASAMATGYKTDNGRISQLPNGTNMETVLELAQQQRKKTGLVSTAYFYHATPAAFASHVDSRYDHQEIIKQMLASDTDLIFGGGIHYENLAKAVDYSTLVDKNNYSEISTKSELNSFTSEKTIGTFNDGHLPFEADINPSTDVRLSDMATAAVENLDNENGFFLMIEGARIDHAGHDNNATRNALEVIQFDYTVQLLHEWVQTQPDTLVIVTADHETGGLVIDSTSSLDDNLPANLDNEEDAQQQRISRAQQIDTSYTQSQNYHTDQEVPVYAFGKGADQLFVSDNLDNTDIFSIISDAYAGIDIETDISEEDPTTSVLGITPLFQSIIGIVTLWAIRRKYLR